MDYKKKHALFLAGVHQNKYFKDWLKDAEDDIPQIPPFDPREQVSLETWAYYSGMIEGYKLLASYLGVNLNGRK